MPRFIKLYDAGRAIGEFDLPEHVEGHGGRSFRLGRVVRGGGNGIVFESRVTDGRDSRVCAVKFLRQLDQTRLDRFQNEVRILSSLSHPRIATFFDCGEVAVNEGRCRVAWMAMELGGSNLRDDIARDGRLSLPQLLDVGDQICDALTHLHERGYIHRDIKPDNFVWDGNETGRIKMIDFGIAKQIGEDTSGRPLDQFTRQMEFVGPVFFSSPELIAYASDKTCPVDFRSDLFQFGKVLWFLATGKISAGVPSRSDCPAGGRIRELVLSLISDNPSERPATPAEVRRLLAQIPRS